MKPDKRRAVLLLAKAVFFWGRGEFVLKRIYATTASTASSLSGDSISSNCAHQNKKRLRWIALAAHLAHPLPVCARYAFLRVVPDNAAQGSSDNEGCDVFMCWELKNLAKKSASQSI